MHNELWLRYNEWPKLHAWCVSPAHCTWPSLKSSQKGRDDIRISKCVLSVASGQNTPQNRCFTNNKPHTGRRKGQNAVTFVPGDIDFKLVEARDQIRLPCEFGANLFSGSRDISYTNIKTTDWWRQKQNLPQFTAWSNKATNGNNKTS